MQSAIELLAPAGNWDCVRAAIENGADAVYFGLDVGFNARARATNFHVDDLPQLMETLHRQSVRGYVTLNTLVFTDELPRLEENVRLLAAAGVDAVLVQDIGAARLIRAVCPELVLHASTQMTLTTSAAIEQVRELGIQRAVLARELSIREITRIRSETTMPLEVFVHGALCVAYSGQCLTSESLGGRSANRGQCAQACRLPYDLICDGKHQDLSGVQYLLSPQDLAAHDLIPQLLVAGVCSLKIEGRLKTPEYVANVCQHYRHAIDAALANIAKSDDQETNQSLRLSDQQRRELELSFSRGFSPGWLEGCDHKRLVPGRSSSKRGVLIGYTKGLNRQRLTVHLDCPIAPGDGIVLEGDRASGSEIGGRVYEIWQDGHRVDRAEQGLVEIVLQRGLLDGRQIPNDVAVYKTDDPQLTKRLRRSFEGPDPVKRVPIHLEAFVTVGLPLKLVARVPRSHFSESVGSAETSLTLQSDYIPETARKHPLDQHLLEEQLGRLGGSVYRLERLEAQLHGSPMVPLSVLGKLRHELIQRLDQARRTQPLPCHPGSIADQMLAECSLRTVTTTAIQPATLGSPSNASLEAADGRQTGLLRVLCRSLEQLRQVLAVGVDRVIADFHDLRQYRDAVDLARDYHATVELATLRIHKPGEDGLLHAIRRHFQRSQAPDASSEGESGTGAGRFPASSGFSRATNQNGWLVRNLAALRYCRQHSIPFAADFSLNVTNPLSAEQFQRWGASRVTASYDLNRDQLIELANQCRPDFLEVVIHQHIPMFHMEHCVFCSVLSPGKNKTDCGRPCDRHDVKLRDRVGAEHVLHADIGCRNTLYNASAQSGAEAVAPLMKLGIRQFRIELLRDTTQDETARLVGLYQSLIAGQIDGAQVWKELKADNRIGVTRGTLEQPRNPLAIL